MTEKSKHKQKLEKTINAGEKEMKIDYSKVIENFDNMTAEEKVKAMLEYEVADPDYSGYVTKATFDKTASDLATAKRELKSHLSKEEQDRQDREEKYTDLQKKYDALMKTNTITAYTAKFTALGYDEKLAKETAEAMADGDMDKVFENQAAFKASLEKTIKAGVLKDTPRPVGDGATKTMTKETLSKMSMVERLNWANTHQEEYEELMKEGE